jgi:acyl dehydratase
MREFRTADELAAAVGEPLGRSSWHKVEQKQVDLFAEVTGDHQWIHVDQERAATGPYGQTIAHGLLTMSISQHLAYEVYDVVGRKMGLNYGANKLRFPAPLPIPAEIAVTVELLQVGQRGDLCEVVSRVTTEAAGIAKPVCVFEPVTLYQLAD